MKKSRRSFFKKGLFGSVLLTSANFINAGVLNMIIENKKVENPFHLGMAGFTFVKFDLETTLRTLQCLDIHYLCIKDFHLPYDCTDEQIKDLHTQCALYGITGYAVGPINMKTKEEVDHAFEYARRVGVKLIVGVPTYDLLPYVNKKVKEYDFHYAIHLHGPDLPVFPDAQDVWVHTKNLDPRIGMCLDIGHDMRSGNDPVADLERYHSRVFDMHIKDVTDSTKAGHCIELGRGKIDFQSLVKMMRKVNYTGMCSLEYEKDRDDPFLGIAESIGYFKAVCDMIN